MQCWYKTNNGKRIDIGSIKAETINGPLFEEVSETDSFCLEEKSFTAKAEIVNDKEWVKFMKEIRESIQKELERRNKIWHDGTLDERAAVLEEDAEDYMYGNFDYRNYRF